MGDGDPSVEIQLYHGALIDQPLDIRRKTVENLGNFEFDNKISMLARFA